MGPRQNQESQEPNSSRLSVQVRTGKDHIIVAGKIRMKMPYRDAEEYQWGDWHISTVRTSILDKDQDKSFGQKLQLPHLPDMTFGNNVMELKMIGSEGKIISLKFMALDALKCVNNKEGDVKVSMSESWLNSRKGSSHIHKLVHNYDWTFTPVEYKGTTTFEDPDQGLEWQKTEERIDYEKLKQKEQILFFEDIILFEDELDDNGCSKLSAKIRVMPSGFFVLLKFYLRVDDTLVRVNETRIYHEKATNTILREYIEKEAKVADLKVDTSVLIEPNEIVKYLNLQTEVLEKLSW